MKARALAIAALALAASGCGARNEIEAPRTAGVELSRLIVHESRVTDGPVYIEGSVSFLGVAPATADEEVEATEVHASGTGAVIFDKLLAPGEYRVLSQQRPCDGNCGYLDPPTDQCVTTLDLRPSETRDLTIVVRPGSPCRFTGD